MYGLCIKLFIINRRAINRSCHIDDNIASAAGSIGQQIFMITGSDERSVPTHLLSSCTAWSSDVDNRFLENMFQKCLLICLVLIKFVHIDKQETIERQLCIPFVTEINSVGIVCLQFGWNQTPAKVDFLYACGPTSNGTVQFAYFRSICRQCATIFRNQR